MSTTLSRLGTTVTLPDDLSWSDRHSWSPVEQSVENSITGALIIDIGTRTTGRPITLESGLDYAWIPYSVVDQLKAWALIPDCQMSLNIHGGTYDVMFRHQEKPAVDVSPIVEYANPNATDWFYGTIKLMEI